MARNIFIPLIVQLFTLPWLGLAQAHAAPPVAPTSAFAGFREEVRRADSIVRFEVRSVKFKRAPDDWKPIDPIPPEMLVECVGVVRTVYKGVATRVGEELKLTIPLLPFTSYYRDVLTKVGRQFFDGSIPSVGDDRVFFLKVTENRFEVFNSSKVFFDWVIDSDSLFRRYVELSWTDPSETAVALVKLLVKILLSDPARGDPYSVRAVILDDWQRYRRSLVPNGSTAKLVSLVVPDMVTTARYAAEGAPLPIVIALAPLLPDEARREVVGALLRLHSSLDDPSPVSEAVEKRRKTLRATVPVMLELVMHPTRDAAIETDPNAVIVAARTFAGEAVGHTDPSWNDWVAHLADKSREADKAREEQADIGSLTNSATDVILAERSTEKVGNEYHLVLFKVLRWIKSSSEDKSAPQSGFVYVRITPETKPLLPRIKAANGSPAQVMVFLTAVPESVSRTWSFRGQQLSTIDPRRFEVANRDNGIISVADGKAGPVQ